MSFLCQILQLKVEFQLRGAAHIHGTIWVDFEKYFENLVRSEQAVRLEKWANYKTSEKFIELTANLEKLSYYVSSDGSEVTDLNDQVWPLEEFFGVLIPLTRKPVNKSKHEFL